MAKFGNFIVSPLMQQKLEVMFPCGREALAKTLIFASDSPIKTASFGTEISRPSASGWILVGLELGYARFLFAIHPTWPTVLVDADLHDGLQLYPKGSTFQSFSYGLWRREART